MAMAGREGPQNAFLDALAAAQLVSRSWKTYGLQELTIAGKRSYMAPKRDFMGLYTHWAPSNAACMFWCEQPHWNQLRVISSLRGLHDFTILYSHCLRFCYRR
jgi:hypothetical protein